MRFQYFLIEAIARPICPNGPRRFPSPTGRILLPMFRREKEFSLVRPSVLLPLLYHTGALSKSYSHSLVNTCPPCGRANGPVFLAGWLQVIALLDSHSCTWPLAQEQDHPARPRREYSLNHMGNQNQPPPNAPDPVPSQLILSDPPLTHGWCGRYLVSFLDKELSQPLRHNTEHRGLLVPMQTCPPMPQRPALQIKRNLCHVRVSRVTFPRTTGASWLCG